MEAGNRYLEDVYIDYWNDHFAVEPAVARNAHKKLPKRANLEALFAETLTRTVNHDFTVRYDNRKWQISKSQARGIRPGHKVTVEIRLDGTTHFRFKQRYLDLEVVEVLKRSGPRHTKAPKTPKTSRAQEGPKASSPYRRDPGPIIPGENTTSSSRIHGLSPDTVLGRLLRSPPLLHPKPLGGDISISRYPRTFLFQHLCSSTDMAPPGWICFPHSPPPGSASSTEDSCMP